ncbi:MAG: hypothetical protein AAF346_15810, partial [Pseudomonadota bacterium]
NRKGAELIYPGSQPAELLLKMLNEHSAENRVRFYKFAKLGTWQLGNDTILSRLNPGRLAKLTQYFVFAEPVS